MLGHLLDRDGRFILQMLIVAAIPYLIWKQRTIKKYAPLVVVQILAGITLGPSILGKLSPTAFNTLFPTSSMETIAGLSLVAIIFFGFMTGMEFDHGVIKGKGRAFAATSLSTILTPLILAFPAGWFLWAAFPDFAGARSSRFTFALAIAIACSVTALPVLGATLIDMKLNKSSDGQTSLGYATVNDAVLWLLVSFLLSLTGSKNASGSEVMWILTLTIVFVFAMIFGVRKLLVHMLERGYITTDPHNGQLVILFTMLFASAFVTHAIGVHFLLGAFVFGAVIPSEIREPLHHKIDGLISVVALPFFFMSTGLKTEFSVSSSAIWIFFGIVTILSSLGKFFGTVVPAIKFGESKRTAYTLGGLMQCKGLMEVLVLTMMLNAGVLSSLSFSAMILMAVFTTAITKPFVMLMRHRHKHLEVVPNQTAVAARA